MTDEELAEEYADSQIGCGDGYYEWTDIKQAFLAGLKAKTKWHELYWEKDFPKVDKLVRVRTMDGSEYICQTYLYIPTEDEIGYGSTITQFEELNGDWIDDNEIKYWCYIEPFKE